MTNRIVIKQHFKFVDVFHGDVGFEPHTWTRLLHQKGRLLFVKGAKLASDDYKQVISLLKATS